LKEENYSDNHLLGLHKYFSLVPALPPLSARDFLYALHIISMKRMMFHREWGLFLLFGLLARKGGLHDIYVHGFSPHLARQFLWLF
jgi:hypothetical protein